MTTANDNGSSIQLTTTAARAITPKAMSDLAWRVIELCTDLGAARPTDIAYVREWLQGALAELLASTLARKHAESAALKAKAIDRAHEALAKADLRLRKAIVGGLWERDGVARAAAEHG